jgi:hypothetical protein
MTEPQPLKNKEHELYGKGQSGVIILYKDDVASAVKWLREELCSCSCSPKHDIVVRWVSNKIDEAFADVVVKK